MNKEEIEIWKDIEGFEGLYMVSNLGNVKSLNYNHTKEERILKQVLDRCGYYYVGLYKDNKQKHCSVHRLIAKAFIPNIENKPNIDHINTIRTDNRIENLRWVTQKENNDNPLTKIKHSKALKGKTLSQEHKDKIAKTHKGKPKLALQKPILQFSKDGKFIKEWSSGRQVERELSINHSSIVQCCKGNYNTASGYIWQYADIKKVS